MEHAGRVREEVLQLFGGSGKALGRKGEKGILSRAVSTARKESLFGVKNGICGGVR